MRLIGTLEDEQKAQIFSQFLSRKKIAHQIEIEKENDWGNPSYGISYCHVWISDEDHLKEAVQWFQHFQLHPEDPIFLGTRTPSAPPPPPKKIASSPNLSGWEKQPMGMITRVLLAICCILFFLSQILIPAQKIPEKYAALALFTSPVERLLLYDFPTSYELIARFIRLYGYENLENPESLAPEGERLLQKINHTSTWPGFYEIMLKEGWKGIANAFHEYPTFEKIREGQYWRLFTPCLLHLDLLHIFFNMLWLIVLGKQMEQRLSPLRYILFILIVGIISNTAQYLMSGPNFVGFSGILVGMLAFIWMRQRHAAWEGYQIDKLTFIFMLLFILGMAGIQIASFVLEKSYNVAFSPNIANIAHLTGGLLGLLFGRLSYFRWRQI